ncbi:hypothetical protein KaCgl_12850 [Corynebacterium glutamicum]|nr:hypothetical protein KaCgl_12850 [Corynebacterium glutamicum]
MRGLAMILIAVAVLLAAWALWSMQGKDDTSTTSAGQTQSTETNAGTIAESSGSSDSEQASAEPGTSEETSAEQPAADGEAANAAGTAAAGGASSANGNSTPVNTLYVLNNSTVPQLAARVADSLSGDYQKVESGNLPDTIIPQNTVYFTAGNTEAEKAARELADRVSGVAMERSDALPTETEGKDALVLVLVQDVAL